MRILSLASGLIAMLRALRLNAKWNRLASQPERCGLA